MNSGTLVKTKDLTKTFGGEHALDNVSVSIPRKKVTALVGDNGAGKSTFCKILSGAYQRDKGEVFFEGENLEINSPAEAKNLGIEMLYQDGALIEDVDVPGNIFAGREEYKINFGPFSVLDKKEMKKETKNLLKTFNIRGFSLNEPVRNLSGGQQQATAISRTLIGDPKLLILDEPLAALGAEESKSVKELINNLKDQDITILVISHNLDHVFDLSDHVIVLKAGKLMGEGETEQIPQSDVVDMILGGNN